MNIDGEHPIQLRALVWHIYARFMGGAATLAALVLVATELGMAQRLGITPEGSDVIARYALGAMGGGVVLAVYCGLKARYVEYPSLKDVTLPRSLRPVVWSALVVFVLGVAAAIWYTTSRGLVMWK